MIKKSIKNYNKKIFVLICLIFIFLSPLLPSFGRYTVNNFKEFFYRSKEFYFYSDKLGENIQTTYIDNWSGEEDYTITINMNSLKNNILGTSYDIDYDISYICTSNIACSLNKESGTVLTETHTDSFDLTVTPNAVLKAEDEIKVEITATSKTNYNKTLTGEFIFKVGTENVTYMIEDKPDSQYLEVSITNPYSEACDISLQFDPNEITIDTTDENYINSVSTGSTQIASYTYVNKFTFKMDPLSSTKVRFYKNNVSNDYSYPNIGNKSIVILSVS